jgi:hypothetical protein
MPVCDKLRRKRPNKHGGRIAGCAALVVAAALAGCSVNSDGIGALGVDPGFYSALHCKDLVGKWQQLTTKENELRALMDRASDGGGGTVIGALSYRTDFELVQSQKKLLVRTAAEKKCELPQPPTYQSDQTIR